MGEIADMMLDGTLCGGCGVYLPGEGDGVPRFCRDCRSPRPHPTTRVACPRCGKLVKAVGLRQHKRDAHGEKQ